MATIYYCQICEELIVDEDELPTVGDFCSRKCEKLFDKYGLEGGKKEFRKKGKDTESQILVNDVPVRNLPAESIPESIQNSLKKKKSNVDDDKNVVFKNSNSFFTTFIGKKKSKSDINSKKKDYDDSLEYFRKQSEIEHSMRGDVPDLDNSTGNIPNNNNLNKQKEQLNRPSRSRVSENHRIATPPPPPPPNRVENHRIATPPPPPSRVENQRISTPPTPPSSRVENQRPPPPPPPSRVENQRISTPPTPPPSRVENQRISTPPPSRVENQRPPPPPPPSRVENQRPPPPPPSRVENQRMATPSPPPRVEDQRTLTPPPRVEDQLQAESQSLYPDIKPNRPPIEDFDSLDINEPPPSYDTLYPDPPPQPVKVEKSLPLQSTERKPITTDQKKPIVTDQKKPIVTDQKKPIVTDQKKPIVTDQKKPIVTDQKKPIVTDKESNDKAEPPRLPPKVPPKVSIPTAKRDITPPQPQTRPYSNQFPPNNLSPDSNSYQQYYQIQQFQQIQQIQQIQQMQQMQQNPHFQYHQYYQQSQGNNTPTDPAFLQEQASLPSTVYPPPFYTTRYNKNNGA